MAKRRERAPRGVGWAELGAEVPLRVFTQQKPTGGFLANVVVRAGATGAGCTERSAIASAVRALLDELEREARDVEPERIDRG
jgi:hypothetical protein